MTTFIVIVVTLFIGALMFNLLLELIYQFLERKKKPKVTIEVQCFKCNKYRKHYLVRGYDAMYQRKTNVLICCVCGHATLEVRR